MSFTLETDQLIKALVVSVYDGDTIKLQFKHPCLDKEYIFNCRINGIDTPELRTRNKKEKEMGYKVRDCLRTEILNKIVSIKCGPFDKYGRLLVDVHTENNINISDWLIKQGYAKSYHGGTKEKWF